MELKLKEGKFFLLDAGKEKSVFESESEAISGLKRIMSGNEKMDASQTVILEVDTDGEKWNIKQIPWSKIAMELIKGGK
jgi:phosphoribosylamine-glycine ligase